MVYQCNMFILQTQLRNMMACMNTMFMQKILNEDVIDYDLLEDLISYIDEVYPVGAVLVFLPVSPLT